MQHEAPDNFDPEFVYHFLSDVDIRLKDAKFRAFQESEMRNFICELTNANGEKNEPSAKSN